MQKQRKLNDKNARRYYQSPKKVDWEKIERNELEQRQVRLTRGLLNAFIIYAIIGILVFIISQLPIQKIINYLNF